MKNLPAVQTGIAYLSIAEGAAADGGAGAAVAASTACATIVKGGSTNGVGVEA